ncbi:MAG: sigma 54-interacting transcriptional regulator [Syntrophomonadaceae bacterium]|nr:sigma 54-interacting transcriptional regulator [Syntrophomonadaceae bacterium]
MENFMLWGEQKLEIGRILEALFTENQFMAAMIVDDKGRIVSISETYLKVLNLSREEVIGRPAKEITPHTRVMNVLKNGKAVVGYNWRINDHNMIASTIPIIQEGMVVGAFAYSVFMDIWNAQDTIENLITEINMYKDEVDNLYKAKYSFDDIIGKNEAFRKVKKFARQVAQHTISTVLLCGESGTGKELFAQAIHNQSSRSRFPFLRINCAAIPENLLEAELFGYEEGAFTGAKKGGKPGKFELANGGTIFLDEIGEMTLTMQSKLLVALQEQEIERLGGRHPIKVNVRVIAASNKNLENMIESGIFREDLYYRLNVVRLDLPPLRKRADDIPLLCQHIITHLNCRLHTGTKKISSSALEMLSTYAWPGNVRELENVLERAMILADMEKTQVLDERHFMFIKKQLDLCRAAHDQQNLKNAVREFERDLIEKALQDADYDRVKAAELLGIDLSTLYRKLKKYGYSA